VTYRPPLHPYEIRITLPGNRDSTEDRPQCADTTIQWRHFAEAPVPKFMPRAPSQDYVLRNNGTLGVRATQGNDVARGPAQRNPRTGYVAAPSEVQYRSLS
jgi:hypothetical protein